jgi:hypothetical protein
MHFLFPTSKWQVMKLKEVGRMEFLVTLGGSYGFAEEREETW